MRIHAINFLIAAVVSALLTYGIVSIDSNSMKGLIGIGSFIFLASTLAIAIGVSFENARTEVNVKIVAGIFFAAAFFLNLAFAFIPFSQTSYIITYGIIFLLYVLIANGIYAAKQ
jgi:hypothetical protein